MPIIPADTLKTYLTLKSDKAPHAKYIPLILYWALACTTYLKRCLIQSSAVDAHVCLQKQLLELHDFASSALKSWKLPTCCSEGHVCLFHSRMSLCGPLHGASSVDVETQEDDAQAAARLSVRAVVPDLNRDVETLLVEVSADGSAHLHLPCCVNAPAIPKGVRRTILFASAVTCNGLIQLERVGRRCERAWCMDTACATCRAIMLDALSL